MIQHWFVEILPSWGLRAPQVKGSLLKFNLHSPDVGHYMINNIESCIQFLEYHPGYIRINKFQYLVVYERSTT